MSDTYRLQKPAPRAEVQQQPTISGTAPGEREKVPGRLVSLDAYRGFIMTMLAASGFGIARLAALPEDNAVWTVWDYASFQRLKFHFTHPAWESITGWMGVSFWDMIQPAFMFMVGVAMPFSYARRSGMGSSKVRRALHALLRAVILTLMGVFLYSLRTEQTNWIFTNVLAQIGLGYFFAYLLLGQSAKFQMGAVAAILVGYWGFFMLNPPPPDFDYAAVDASAENGEIYDGRFAPWSKNANGAHFFDKWFLNVLRMPKPETLPSDTDDGNSNQTAAAGKAAVGLIRQWWFSSPELHTHNRGGYVTLNFVPSIATTLLGILCGQLLLGGGPQGRKLVTMIAAGAFCVALGVLAHHTVCPIVKRIWTPSWVLFSGGYAIWMLAGFYLLFDILPLRKLAFPLVVVGMNSIAMYMMGQMLRPWATDKIVITHFGGVLTTLLGEDALKTDGMGAMVLPTAAFTIFWLIALWMYRNRYIVRV